MWQKLYLISLRISLRVTEKMIANLETINDDMENDADTRLEACVKIIPLLDYKKYLRQKLGLA